MGGDTVMVEVSAKQKTNLNKLLEMILLVADFASLKSNPKSSGAGTVLESAWIKAAARSQRLWSRQERYIPATFLLRAVYGKVRAMLTITGVPSGARGHRSVEVLGLQGAPDAGDQFQVADEARARHIVEFRQGKLA